MRSLGDVQLPSGAVSACRPVILHESLAHLRVQSTPVDQVSHTHQWMFPIDLFAQRPPEKNFLLSQVSSGPSALRQDLDTNISGPLQIPQFHF